MKLEQEWNQHQLRENEQDFFHRAQSEELAFYHAVSTGDIDTVRENCEQQRFSDSEGMGRLSKNPLTNIKYHFVITTALVVRFCVAAGMEMELAYSLSDFYILKLDNIYTTNEVVDLHHNMVMDFTEKMRQLQNTAGVSKLVNECIEYIYVHIRERITISALSAHTGFSASYLSHLFKEEIGTSVSDYIREKKIEKAQNLLKYCDYSLVEIANYLSFASQSHFTQVFQKQVGITPKKYRDIHYCTDWDISE